MNRIPSLDLMNGKVVRLLKGDFDQSTVYFEDPCICVEALIKAGASCIHIVDLDQTRKFTTGDAGLVSANSVAIDKVISEYQHKLTLQLGGGIRSYETAKSWFEKGIHRIVVSTLFFSDYEGYIQLVRDYPNRVVLALDVKDYEVCHTGWQVDSGQTIDAILRSGKTGDVHSILVTDISTDGMLTGPNLELLKRLNHYPLIASGGITSEADCMAIKSLGIQHAIIGKAYYEGRLTKLGVV